MKSTFLFVFFLIISLAGTAQDAVVEGKYYTSTRGEPIYMPIGKLSFADRVVEFIQGNPKAQEDFTNPDEALGEPNYVHYKVPRYVSLGCGGQLTLEFTDNGFVNMEGPDLYVWEVGPSEESFQFEISKDGKNWLDLGIIEGGKSYIDIESVVTDIRDVFYFVRITDQKEICTGNTPGADIDAVGTISGVLKINLSADVLFDTAKHNLKPIANASIDSLAKQIKQVGMAKIIVEGHTDSDGSDLYNLRLSERRTRSVITKLKSLLDDNGIYDFESVAYGLTKPRSTNETEEGKQLNRRVEVIVLPHRDFYSKKN
jgi:outer membrane protein OmpA-like peptidoglycan-associated protein